MALLCALLLWSAPRAAAQATPTPAALDIPDPNECQTEPRPLPLFPAGVGQLAPATPRPLETPPGAPFVAPVGTPANAETVAAVQTTVREALACRNAGDYLRAYALFTEKMLVQLFGGPATIDPAVADAIANGPHRLPEGRRIGLVSVGDVADLADGRVGALVTTATSRRVFHDYLYFSHDPGSGRWLIDETVALPETGGGGGGQGG